MLIIDSSVCDPLYAIVHTNFVVISERSLDVTRAQRCHNGGRLICRCAGSVGGQLLGGHNRATDLISRFLSPDF